MACFQVKSPLGLCHGLNSHGLWMNFCLMAWQSHEDSQTKEFRSWWAGWFGVKSDKGQGYDGMFHREVWFLDPKKSYEHLPKPPTFWNSYARTLYARTLIPDSIMTLSGVTQRTMTFDTHVWQVLLHTLNPQERSGTHKKRWPFQPCPFTGVIGLVHSSYQNAT